MSTPEALNHLEALLGQETAAWAELLAATEEHHAALLSGQAPVVEASLRKQLAAMDRCRPLSEARTAFTRELAAELALGEPCSTGRLLAALPGEAPGLKTAHAALRELAGDLRTLNAANHRLGEHRLDLLQDDYASMQSMIAAATGGHAEDGRPVEGSLLSLRA